MNIVLWIVQILLALAFLFSGASKAFSPLATLAENPMLLWVNDVPPPIVRLPGIAEIVGAVGLILPSLKVVPPKLTPLAGLGLMLVMLAALVFHLARGEMDLIGGPIVLLILSTFVTIGRWKIAPIAAK